MRAVFRITFDSLRALVNRNTDVGANQLMGVISIAKTYLGTDSLPQILWFTILINVSLAILNILPIPVLDGGHIVFATLQKVRGKPLPANVHAGIHYVFMLLLFFVMGYVLLNDVKRCSGDNALNHQGLIYQRYVAVKANFLDEKAKPAPAPETKPEAKLETVPETAPAEKPAEPKTVVPATAAP
jgi:Zn-dependent protease